MKACWGAQGSLIALIFNCQGLQLSIERTPGAHTCAHLTCSNVAHTNESIFSITSIKILDGYNEIRIDMELNGVKYFAHYSNFSVDGEILNYKLTVSGYSGTAGDSFTYNSGMMFSTKDRDNDISTSNCAVDYTSGWWYHSCYHSNLNGIWGKNGDGVVIWDGIEKFKSLSSTEMKVRRN